MQIGAALHTPVNDVLLSDDWADRRRFPEWENLWGEERRNNLHLGSHAQSPVVTNHAPVAHIVAAPAYVRPPHAVLVLSAYQGWYKRLHRLGAQLPVRPDGDSWRVDVIVRPLGWLGLIGALGSPAGGFRVGTGGTSLELIRHFPLPYFIDLSPRPSTRRRRSWCRSARSAMSSRVKDGSCGNTDVSDDTPHAERSALTLRREICISVCGRRDLSCAGQGDNPLSRGSVGARRYRPRHGR